MAENIHQIHNNLFEKVMPNLDAATDLLQRHLPEVVSRALSWPTLKQINRSFIDEDLRGTKSDFVYEAEYAWGKESVFIYLLVEHQSTPDKWLRFRLLRYCCRLWETYLDQKPTPSELRPIVPLVFYQGERTWTYTTEFADLFAEWARGWPGTPRFAHELVDQSGMEPEAIEGELKVRMMQLVMLAAYHPERPWMEVVGELLGILRSLPPSGGINYFNVFIEYLIRTQEPEAIERFRDVLRGTTPRVGEELMTYAEQLTAEGRTKGRVEERVAIIANLLQEGTPWGVIERVTGVDETEYETLKEQVREIAD